MGFFSSYFGGTEYSTIAHPLTTDELNHLFWNTHHPNLSEHQKHLVEDAILKKRDSSGKISLHHIHEILLDLSQHQHLISEFDRKDLQTIFKTYFDTHFKG